MTWRWVIERDIIYSLFIHCIYHFNLSLIYHDSFYEIILRRFGFGNFGDYSVNDFNIGIDRYLFIYLNELKQMNQFFIIDQLNQSFSTS